MASSFLAGIRGDEDHDRRLVCRWIAESYGEEDEDYHRCVEQFKSLVSLEPAS